MSGAQYDITSSKFLTLDEAAEATGLSSSDVKDVMIRNLHPGVGYLFYAAEVEQARDLAAAAKRGNEVAVQLWESKADANSRRLLENLILARRFFRKDKRGNPIEFPDRQQVLDFASSPWVPYG